LRFDIDPTPTFPIIPDPTAAFPEPGCATGEEFFIRDIVLDEVEPLAYVAAYSRGVLEFDVSGLGLDHLNTVTPQRGGSQFSAVALAFAQVGYTRLLAVGFGAPFKVDSQYWGNANLAVPCDDSVQDNSIEGIMLFKKAMGGSSFVQQGSIPYVKVDDDPLEQALPKPPVAITTRSVNGQEVLFDVACDVEGLVTLSAQPIGPGGKWIPSRVGSWDATNCETGPCSDDVPGGSFDDIAQLGNFVYVSTEGALLTFATNGAQVLLDDFVDLDTANTSAILLAGFAADSLGHAMLYSYAITGVRFFDLSNPDDPAPSVSLLNTRGRGYAVFPSLGLEPVTPTRWLYVVNQADDEPQTVLSGACVSTNKHGGLRVFRVGLEPEPNSMNVPLLGTFAPCDSYVEAHGTYLDCIAVPVDADTHAVYVTYGPDGEAANPETATEPDSGLLVLEATYLPATDAVEFTFIKKIDFAGSLPTNGPTSRLTYDTANDLLYACHACQGVARYDVSDKLDPQADGEFVFPAPPSPKTPHMSSLKAWPAPDGKLFISMLRDGVAILPADLSGGFINQWRTPYSANAFLEAPASEGQPPGSALYVADGRGGLLHVQFFDF